MESTSAATWVLVGSGVIFLSLTYTSAWLRGPTWFAAILVCLAVSLAAMSALALPGTSTAQPSATAAFVALLSLYVFAFFFYLIGGRYITRTKIFDLTFQSRAALNQYLEQNRIISPLAHTLRAMPVVLVGGLVVLVGFGYWAQSKGLLT